MKRYATLCLALAAAAHVGPMAAQQKNDAHWVASWTTAQPLIRMPPPAPRPAVVTAPGAPAAAAGRGGPGRQMNPAMQAINTRGFQNQTVRMIVRMSLGGSRIRVKFSNPFGGTPVVVGKAHVALRSTESGIVPASDHALTFDGKPGFTIQPGVVLLSDPVDLTVAKLSDLAVTLFFPEETGPPSSHSGMRATYISKEGDVTDQPTIPDAITTQADYWLAGVDVMAPASSSAIVALGDSITEGYGSTPDTNHTWPALLAERILANKSTANMSVVNVGIGGNRLLHDGTGASVLARFDHDVLTQAGVKWVIILESINDIGRIGRPTTAPADAVTADDLIAGFRQIIDRAHTFGIKVAGCTLPPYEGASSANETGEAALEALNTWIRTGHMFDAVIDFEAATKDPANPKRLRPEFDLRDHLHPNDAGYQAMAEAVNLAIFSAKR